MVGVDGADDAGVVLGYDVVGFGVGVGVGGWGCGGDELGLGFREGVRRLGRGVCCWWRC